ncbi:MAG: hypothetical protein KIT73_08860, partial [Burkholderiales bacterium]|nr:hypothetical protein [Burkholderiales bacterium]
MTPGLVLDSPSAEVHGARREARRGLLLALPAVLWTVAFFVLPSAAIAVWSFFRRDGGQLVT